MPAGAPPPTSVIHRFSLFIEALKRAMAENIRPREHTLAAMGLPLLTYLGHTLRRLAALHARFAAGRLAAAQCQSAAPRPAADRPRAVRRPPCIPRGPVLLRFYLVHFVPQLRDLVEEPEMRALLAASPRAGRLLRPLWRKLTPDPLPEPLRLARKPRRAKAQPEMARSEKARVAPAKPPAPPADAPTWWHPGAPAKPPASLPPWPPPLFGPEAAPFRPRRT